MYGQDLRSAPLLWDGWYILPLNVFYDLLLIWGFRVGFLSRSMLLFYKPCLNPPSLANLLNHLSSVFLRLWNRFVILNCFICSVFLASSNYLASSHALSIWPFELKNFKLNSGCWWGVLSSLAVKTTLTSHFMGLLVIFACWHFVLLVSWGSFPCN